LAAVVGFVVVSVGVPFTGNRDQVAPEVPVEPSRKVG
jgi:hypothetical protein